MGDTNMLMHARMHTRAHTHTHTQGYYSAIKRTKECHLSNMDGPTQSRTKEERQIPYDTTDTWNLKYDTNEHITKTETDSQREQTCARQLGGRVGKRWGGNLGLADRFYYI